MVKGSGHSETTPPPKYKIGNMKRKCEEEEEKEEEEDEKEGKTEVMKRVRSGGEGRKRWRGSKVEEYGKTCVTHSQFGIYIYNTVIFTIRICNADIKQEDINYYY